MSQNSLQKAVYRSNLIAPGDRLLIAVSGGPDSVALLHILYDLRRELALHLEVAHLQHGIRGAESETDARFVQALAQRLNLPAHIGEANIPRMRSDAGRGNLEGLARAARYRFFSEVTRQHNLDKIATAHTRDDQVETVLMWLLRGAGRTGLAGIAPRQTIHSGAAKSSKSKSFKELTVIRPLLGVTKGELLDFLEENGFEFHLDRTNEDTGYLRNWLRLKLIPLLKERIDSRLPGRLAHMAQILGDEDALLDSLAQNELGASGLKNDLSREALLRQPLAMERRMLRLWIARSRGHLRGIDFDHIEALLGLVGDGPPQGRLAIPGGWELVREYDTLQLRRPARGRTPVCYSYPLNKSGETEIAEAHMAIQIGYSAIPPAQLPRNHWEAVFDDACLTGSLVVRNFRRGDRFEPFGMAGHQKKVKQLFIDNKVPLSARAAWPMLVMGGEILWIPGYGRSEAGKISPTSREFVHLKALIMDR